tara:strand:+ start:865 stop:1257 length:393 start_codon:yes stop_codon:yes gene_type:complete
MNTKLEICRKKCKYSIVPGTNCKNREFPGNDHMCNSHQKQKYSNKILYVALTFVFYFCKKMEFHKKYKTFQLICKLLDKNDSMTVENIKHILMSAILNIKKENSNKISIKMLCRELGIPENKPKLIRIIK